MKLPLPLVENVKSLISRVVYHREKADPQWFLSVLGQYATDALLPSDYFFNYTVNGEVTPVLSFATVSDHMKVKLRDSKGATVWKNLVEQPISLIDGTTSPNTPVFINNPQRLTTLAGMWNEWLATLAQFSSPLSVMASDIGVNIACSAAMTRHWNTVSNNQKMREAIVLDDRLAKVRASSVYAQRQIVAISSYPALLAGPTEQILQQWILPVNDIVEWSEEASTLFTRVQDMMKETSSISLSSGDDGVNMATLHEQYASKMVNGIAGKESDWDTFFAEQTKKGGAGILSSLAANFIGQAFGGTAGSIASTVAGLIPI